MEKSANEYSLSVLGYATYDTCIRIIGAKLVMKPNTCLVFTTRKNQGIDRSGNYNF